ncbi:type IV pilin protein [Psychrobacillus sp. NPDC058041]|uniref:type IV pilin protein n=1 Tax=Psychrobacillus sp. NPDC058041 TaxID=3346310 RepID=UPI0036DE7A55
MKTMMQEISHETIETNSRGNNKMKKFTKILKNQKGLTLIELLAVIVILAIVAAIAVPSISGVIENSKYNAAKADAISVLNAAQLYYTDSPSAASGVTVATLKNEGYLETIGMIPDTATVASGTPKKLTTAAITYSGSKKITFTNSTIQSINVDTTKGSTSGDKTIN